MSLAETLLITQPQKFGLWPSVWRLLRLRVRIWWNAFRRAKLRARIGTIILFVLIVGGMVGLFFLSSLLLRFLQSPQLAQYVNPAQLIGAIPTLVLTSIFVVTVITNFGVLLQALYLSHDMDFLVTTPLPMRAVFVAKMLEGILPNFALFCAFSLPVLFGLGTASGYNLLYYPLLVVMLGMLALAAGGLASVLVMAVVRVIPARRVAEALGVLGALSSILCGQSGNIINAMDPKRQDVSAALTALSQLDTPWSPLGWAGRGLLAIGRGDWLPGLGLTLLSMALAGAVFAATLLLAENLYYSGWSSMQGVAVRRRPRPGKGAAVRAGAVLAPDFTPAPLQPGAVSLQVDAPRRLRFPSQVRALIIKDLLLLRRDPRNVSQLITPLIVGVVMLFSTGRRANGGADQQLARLGLQNIENYGLVLLAMLVGWMLMSNLATLAFSREGKNYWIIKASPVRPVFLLVSKFIVSYLPALAFSMLYIVLAYVLRGAGWASMPYNALVVAMGIAGATGIALAFGAANANLEWDSPQRQRLTGAAGCLSALAVGGFLIFDLLLFLAPPILWQVLGGSQPVLAYLLGGLLGTAAGLAGVFIPPWMVLSRVARIGEH